MKTLHAASFVALATLSSAFALPALAQTTPAVATEQAKPMAADLSDGEIRKISKGSGKLTIKHGPIKSMDMPPMTMVFTAKDPAMLEKLAVGDKVKFAVADLDGKMTVTEIQSVK